MAVSSSHRQGGKPRADEPAKPLLRVLIVVHDRLAGRRLASMLTGKGYEGVRAVSSAARALSLARQYKPSIVFLDVGMTDDAYELARALRQQSGHNGPRLIALTGSIEHSTHEQARTAGFERWLVMPVAQDEVDNLLRRDPDTAA